MKLKFLICAIFMCAIGKISGLYEQVILLNRSNRKCTVNLSEIPSSRSRMTGYLQPSGGSKFSEIAGYGCWVIPDPNLNEFTLDKDEYRCICYNLNESAPQERIVIKANSEEVGAVYLGSIWSVDPNNPKAKFWVNEKLGLVLYQKMPTGRHQLVFKILDFDDEHFRYINPDPKYVYGTHGSSRGVEKEWIITLPKDDNDPRPPYVEREENLPDILKGAKQKILYEDEREPNTMEKIKECCNIC